VWRNQDRRRCGPAAAPALDKGLDIIELLSRQQQGLTRPEIAQRLGRSVSEISS
jgi:DNA-binding IclR family transcriptional regulator